jgi:PBSX family phage terminase large subunit
MAREAIREPKFKALGEKAYAFANRAPEDDKRINILEGAVRSSKTWTMIPKMLALCKYKVGGRRVITGASKTAIYNNVLDDLFEVIGPKNYSYNQQSGKLRLFDSQWRVIGASDAGSEKYIRGMTIGACYCDELVKMPHNVFQMLLSRMSPSGARFYATTNPDSPYHWLREDLLDNKDMQDDLFVEHFGLDDNPNLDESFKEFLKRKYTGIFYQRFVLGKWVLASGSIYRDVLTDDLNYNSDTRPIGLKSRGGHQEHWLAIDDGTVNAFVAIDIYDTGKTAFWDRELYWDSRTEMRQLSNREKVDALMAFMDENAGRTLDPRERPGIIVDPSAASLKVEMTQRGLYVVDAKNDVDDGISRLSSMLNLKKIRINADGCPRGLKEMQTYSWDEKKAENGKEQPIKAHDHYPDAGRYWCETRIQDWRLAA